MQQEMFSKIESLIEKYKDNEYMTQKIKSSY